MSNAHEGVRGHVVDQGRDEARQDRSYTRSSANITPAVFADQLGRRRFNETTARVEEIPEEEAQPKAKSNFPPATSAPINVTVGGRIQGDPVLMIQHKRERCQMDGSFWSDLMIGSVHLPRSRGSSIDGEKVESAALP